MVRKYLYDFLPELRVHQRIWFHRTNNFGYNLVHILDDEGRELARRLNSTGHWEWRTWSPEQWPLEPHSIKEYEFEWNDDVDQMQLMLLESCI